MQGWGPGNSEGYPQAGGQAPSGCGHFPLANADLFRYYVIMMHKRNTLGPGSTIVELLIVIVVIAILAAISTVAYPGLQERARASEVSAALSQAKRKLELYRVDNGNYPASGNLASAGVTSSDESFQYMSDGSTCGGSFCLKFVGGANQTGSTNVDSVMITQGSSLPNFADGYSPNWIWIGTPNISPSTGPAL